MTATKKLHIGIFGFGCVGQGLYTVLNQTHGIKASIKKVCIKHDDKERSIDKKYFTSNKNDILFDDDINVVVELIDDADAAFEIVKTAMQQGKAVVSANKKMIAENLNSLYLLQQQYQVPFLYEGAVCASIPIIRNLEEYYDNDLLYSLEGIINGSTNYILTKIFDENKNFALALSEAQALGFAESDPTLDIEGFDPKYKLCILVLHAFGIFVKPEHIFNFGIQKISDFDIAYATQNNKKIKLIAKCRKIHNEVVAYVFPHFVNGTSPLTTIHNEYNGVLLESAFSDKQFFSGKGAGSTATGSAVLSDISALSYNYKYEYKKIQQADILNLHNSISVKIYVRYKNESDIDETNFEHIEEKYQSAQNKYIAGTITLTKIIETKWAENENINMILY